MIKRLSLILAIIFTVTLSSSAVWASGTNIESSLEASAFFHSVKIAEKYAVPSSEGAMTRKEFADFAVHLMGFSNVTPNYLRTFNDVPDDSEYKRAIHTAVEAKLFDGTGAETFGADEYVTFGQALKVAVNMLGARHKAEMTGGYLAGYYKLANELGLLKNISADYNKPASRTDLMVLMYNTVRADIIYISKVSADNVEYQKEKGKTILSEYHSIFKAEGIITADYYEAISGNTTSDYSRLTLNNELSLVKGRDDFFNLVGKNITAWYREDADKNLLLHITEEDNNVVNIKNNKNSSYNYSTNTYTVYGDSKSFDFKVNIYATILVNGEITDETSKEIMFPVDGNIELIDNNGDNSFDVVKIEKFYNGVIDSFDTYNNKLILKKASHLSASDAAFVVAEDTIIFKDGKLADKTAFSSDSTVMVYKSRSGRIKIEISSRKITGTVISRSENEITVDGDVYTVSDYGYISANEFSAGAYYKFYLNADGDIIFAAIQQQNQVGYVVATGQQNQLKAAKIKILDSGSKVKTYTMPDNVIIETVSGTKKVASSQVGSYLTNGSGLVMFSLNENGEVYQLTLACPVTTKDEFENQPAYPLLKLDYLLSDWPLAQSGSATKAEFNSNAYDINNWVILSNESVMFNVPVPGESLEDNNLTVEPVSGINDGRIFEVNTSFNPGDNCIEFYSYGNGTAYADVIIHYMSAGNLSEDISSDLSAGGYAVVEDIIYALNDNGDGEYQISVIEYGKGRRTLTLNDESLIKREKFGTQTIDTASSVYSDSTVNPQKTEISKGDIIRYMTNSSDHIRSLALMYDAENDVLCYKANMSIRGKSFSQFAGTVERRIGDVVEISDGTNYRERLNLNGEVWIFDAKRKTCKIGSSEDISAGDVAVTYHYYYRYRQTVVYKR
ncbi:MAG: S-layer homology domain-containing protein [Clostridia bacterium]|nr:S-layer homology domain-containing protein [Clostridia bacterium]